MGEKGFSFDKILAVSIKSLTCGLISIYLKIIYLTNLFSTTGNSTMIVASDCSPQFTVYTRRWYVLLIFSLHAMFQCTVWNTWGPVETVALAVFKSWTMADISNFANWGEIITLTYSRIKVII